MEDDDDSSHEGEGGGWGVGGHRSFIIMMRNGMERVDGVIN